MDSDKPDVRWRRAARSPWAFAVLTAVLMALALPSFNLFPLGWFCLIPLLYRLRGCPPKRAFLIGWFSGTLFFVLLLYWVIPLYPYTELPFVLAILVTIVATLLLAGYLGVFWGIFGLFIARWRGRLILYPLFAAAIWTAMEYARAWSLTGMPWGSLGYSQWNNLPAIQIADTVGVYGVSFAIALVNAGLTLIWFQRNRWRLAVAGVAAVLIVVFGYGFWQLSRTPETGSSLEIALVPGNVKQMDKWHGRKLEQIFDRYLNTTEQLVVEPPELFVWPETAVSPMNLLARGRSRYFARLRLVLRQIGSPMLFGTPYPTQSKYYNAAYLLDASGRPLQHYYKMHLVPFGESVPLKKWLPRSWLERLVGSGDYDAGTEIRLFDPPNKPDMKLGVVICFESVFPRDFRKPVRDGANIMGILTNDAWFEGTAAPEQHYAMAPLRAVENRVPVFRCANGGISCIIDAFGRVQPVRVEAPGQGIVRGTIAPINETTLYTRFGNWLPFLCAVFATLYGLVSLIQSRRKQ